MSIVSKLQHMCLHCGSPCCMSYHVASHSTVLRVAVLHDAIPRSRGSAAEALRWHPRDAPEGPKSTRIHPTSAWSAPQIHPQIRSKSTQIHPESIPTPPKVDPKSAPKLTPNPSQIHSKCIPNPRRAARRAAKSYSVLPQHVLSRMIL